MIRRRMLDYMYAHGLKKSYSQNGNKTLDIYMGTLYIINVRVVAKKTIIDFCRKHKEAESQLNAWYYEVKNSSWDNPIQVKEKYGNASIIGDNKVVFNIKGNKFRLVTKISYKMKIVFIKFIGTHKEYDKINVEDM